MPFRQVSDRVRALGVRFEHCCVHRERRWLALDDGRVFDLRTGEVLFALRLVDCFRLCWSGDELVSFHRTSTHFEAHRWQLPEGERTASLRLPSRAAPLLPREENLQDALALSAGGRGFLWSEPLPEGRGFRYFLATLPGLELLGEAEVRYAAVEGSSPQACWSRSGPMALDPDLTALAWSVAPRTAVGAPTELEAPSPVVGPDWTHPDPKLPARIELMALGEKQRFSFPFYDRGGSCCFAWYEPRRLVLCEPGAEHAIFLCNGGLHSRWIAVYDNVERDIAGTLTEDGSMLFHDPCGARPAPEGTPEEDLVHCVSEEGPAVIDHSRNKYFLVDPRYITNHDIVDSWRVITAPFSTGRPRYSGWIEPRTLVVVEGDGVIFLWPEGAPEMRALLTLPTLRDAHFSVSGSTLVVAARGSRKVLVVELGS